VVDVDTGEELFSSNADVPRMPASVEKLYTSAAALLLYGEQGRLSTTVLSPAVPDATGDIAGDLVLRGGGDPTFDSRDANTLAAQLVRAGLHRIDGRVVGDESAFDAFRGPPSSSFLLSSDVGPLSALAYDHGLTGKRRPYFQASPARFAADAFEKALERRGVTVAGKASAGVAPTGMTPLAHYDSPPIADIVKAMNQPSDNYIAETLIKALGADRGTAGSTDAGAAVVRAAVARFNVAPQIQDGSGLSRGDRTTPRQVVRLLSGMAETAPAATFDASLAVVGRNGTLHRRMRDTAAQDRCHAKTGSLRDVSTLAGYCTTLSGRRVAFAFLMNATTTWRAHPVQDAMTAALARLN
jgi:D-alanyl-D-alanine carboxypeptidase/D-alanyl-D-alanine-endopeptidase (penicillin-binding protein 4)